MKRLVLLIALAACGSKTAKPEPVGNQADTTTAVATMPEGDYLCWGGFHEYLCTVEIVGGETRLAKIGGTDLYTGVIEPTTDGGFRLRGANADGAALDLEYKQTADGSWRASVPPALDGYSDYYTIRYMGAAGSVFGSQTYGGGYDEPGHPID